MKDELVYNLIRKINFVMKVGLICLLVFGFCSFELEGG